MQRLTHAVLGTAIVTPLALASGPLLAAGVLVAGTIGGETPDWIDFRTGVRRPLRIRHRGASHALPMLVLLTAALAGAMWMLSSLDVAMVGLRLAISSATGWTIILAFGLGYLSHLLSDACTIGGIQPLLPFAQRRFWLIPRALRSRSDGYLDKLARLAGFSVLGFAMILAVSRVVT